MTIAGFTLPELEEMDPMRRAILLGHILDGDGLRRLLGRHGYTYAEAAVELGVGLRTLQAWISGERDIPATTRALIVLAWGKP